MNRILLSATCMVAIFAHMAQAGEVTGGSVGLGYSAFTDDSAGTVSKTALSGSLEYGFDRNFGLQGDLSLGRLGFVEADTTSFTLHGLYHANETASFGVFLGRDEIEGEGGNFYGFEAGFEQGQLNGDVYAAAGDYDGLNGSLLGIGAAYDATDSFTLGGSYDKLNIEGYDLSRVQLEAEYRMDKFALTGQLGSANVEDAGSETYFGLGARINFGAKRGTTFDRRGLVEALPGL